MASEKKTRYDARAIGHDFHAATKCGCRIRNIAKDSLHSCRPTGKFIHFQILLRQVKNRDAVAALHREGILFTVTPIENPADPLGPPPNLAFLEILTEFTNKLMKLDKRVVLNYLDRHIQASMPGTRTEDWQPLILYRNSLVHGETEQPPPRAPGRQYRGRKRAREDDDPRMDDEGNMDQDSDRGSEN
ncbi:cohesin subunit SA-1 [Trichonephila clavipes]|nr:cohesin subunit SA-1 [Trichonephila clavipes]